VPELPEVETSRLGLLPLVEGREIQEVIVRNASLRWPVPEEVLHLANARVMSLTRRGKYLQFNFPEAQMLVHLGMSGSLRVVGRSVDAGKHDHVDWLLGEGKILRLTDPRRFGAVLWNDQGEQHPLLKHLGVEPLGDNFSGEHLASLAQGRHQAVKTFIMDAKVVVGVGNIYAQESLFLARIHPLRKVSRIRLSRWQLLANTIQEVLRAALKAGGTSLKDFTRTDGRPGYFKQELKVYGRAGQPCVVCGDAIRLIRQGQRSTCYCPRCQH
jgi:formamidopyrimidine-DNA glycosylase